MSLRTEQRARLAALTRHRYPNDPAVESAAQTLALTGLEEHVQKVVSTFPSLSSDQRNRIAALLRPAGDV